MNRLLQSTSILWLLLLLMAGLPAAAAPGPNATIVVTTTADEYGSGSGCSLREAIQAANTNSAFGGCPAGSGTDTITLPAGAYVLARAGANEDNNATGDLDVAGSLEIVGDSQAGTIIDGGDLDRVLHVVSGNVQLRALTIRNGQAPPGTAGTNGTNPGQAGGSGGAGADGGGIYNSGTLTLADCAVSGNAAGSGGMGGNGAAGAAGVQPDPGGDGGNGGTGGRGGYGGGIYNTGTLVMSGATVSANQAGNGGAGGTGGAGGRGADGVDVTGRRAGTDGGAGGRGGVGGSGGPGSGIANAAGGTATLVSCVIAQNTGSGGGSGGAAGTGGRGGDGIDQVDLQPAGWGGLGGSGGNGGSGGGSGRGKGIYNRGTLTLSGSQVENNVSGLYAGTGGQGGAGGNGGNGGDGTEFNPVCDGARSGGGGNGGSGGGGGFGGDGGGLYTVPGDAVVQDSIIRGNAAGLGQNGGNGGNGGNPGIPGTGYEVPPCYNGALGPNGDGGDGGAGGDGGSGGGIANAAPARADESPGGASGDMQSYSLQVERSTLANNNTRAGRSGGTGGASGSNSQAEGGIGGNGGDGGDGGTGGGLSSAYLDVAVQNSTVSGNAAGFGGNSGEGGSGQDAGGMPGAGGNAGFGGGIYNGASGEFRVSNATIAGNTATGTAGGGIPNGTSGRGGGVYDEATFSIVHTLLGNNAANAGPECYNTLESLDYNLIENTAGCTLGGSTGHNVVGADPALGALGDNGGPTPTHLLLPGSPALDNGDTTCYDTYGTPLTADQRGRQRPADGNNNGIVRCDMGSVEVQPDKDLTLTIGGTGTGDVSMVPPDRTCTTASSPCTETYDDLTVVTLTASAGAGASFVGWSGGCSGSSPICHVTMSVDRAATATFDAATVYHTLTVSVAGTGVGNVGSVPAGIDCGDGGTACAASYGADSVVVLTAQAGAGSTFSGWSGACSGTDPTCEVTMDGAKAVAASFTGNAHAHRVYLPLVEK